MQSEAGVQAGDHSADFATTRWSLILRSRISAEHSSQNQDALARLCQIYWRPIFTFISRRGYVVSDAQDLTQEFFLLIFERKIFECADPSRGRFRSFLLKSLKNFLIDAEVKRHRRKRGGDIEFISLEQWMAQAPSQLNIPAHALESCSAEALFDLRWAATVAEEALRRLRAECESSGRRRVYEVLGDYLTADRASISYGRLSTILGISTSCVKRLMHEFRKRYRALLREEIGQTVENAADVDDELRYLCAALSAAAS
jgi:RNA polymerase sigma factor (sigma-70 family)